MSERIGYEDGSMARSPAHFMLSQALAHIGSWELDLDIVEDLNKNPLRWSDELFRIFGYEPGGVEVTNDLFFEHVHPDDRAAIQNAVREALDTGGVYSIEHRIRRKDGLERVVHERGEIILDPKTGRQKQMIGTAQDITDWRILEAKLAESQRMEALGRLAAGVAHDFNNILTVVNNCAELIGEKTSDDKIQRRLGQILRATGEAAALTHQLLAFSRQSILERKSVNLNTLLEENRGMIKRILRREIKLSINLTPGLWNVHTDPGELIRVILNLAANARDAITGPGEITIETANVDAPADAGKKSPGDFVLIRVRDSGGGMTEDVKAHIFDPFYTTKEVGKGTGLGLATAYGLIRQSGGHIVVESEPGLGATFFVYLPRSA